MTDRYDPDVHDPATFIHGATIKRTTKMVPYTVLVTVDYGIVLLPQDPERDEYVDASPAILLSLMARGEYYVPEALGLTRALGDLRDAKRERAATEERILEADADA